MSQMRWFILLALISVSSFGFAQSELFGPGKFTQTREMSGLSGGSFGVLPDGTPSFDGAMALSTPIGYCLNHWHWAAGLNSISPDMRLRGLDTSPNTGVSGGTGELIVGIPTRHGALDYSLMPISVKLDEVAMNLQFEPNQSGSIRFAAGIQDLQGNTHTFRPRERRSSRSPFIVATANPIKGGYASIGYGNQRFGGVFGNLSQTFGNWKALAEYDTYNWNYGIANRIGHFHAYGKNIEATSYLGYIRGKYATWSLTLTF